MSWYPTDTQPQDPHIAVKTARKVSAVVRWTVLVVVLGLVVAAVVGLGISALFTSLQKGG